MAVDWLELVRADLVRLQQPLADKDQTLAQIADLLSRSPKLARCRRSEILQALEQREAQGSTGLGGGIAAPHCGMKKADDFAIAILTPQQGIDFGAFDSQPCKLFIAIVGPQQERSRHVQILASLASGLQKTEEVQQLLACGDPQQGMEILGRIFAVDFSAATAGRQTSQDAGQKAGQNASAGPTGYSRLSIVVQQEKFFVPLLEEAVRASAGAVMVFEGHNASEFLQRMPIYAYVLHDKKINRFLRCIEALVPNSELESIYDTIRRIDKKIGQKPGLVVSHQPVYGMLGRLDY